MLNNNYTKKAGLNIQSFYENKEVEKVECKRCECTFSFVYSCITSILEFSWVISCIFDDFVSFVQDVRWVLHDRGKHRG